MSVNWSWKAKKGELLLKSTHPTAGTRRFKINIYQANCLGALIYEYRDKETKKDMYRFWGFWNDMTHLKNCLGLTKEHFGEDVYEEVYKVKLNIAYKDNLKVAEAFAKAGHKVELYYESESGKR